MFDIKTYRDVHAKLKADFIEEAGLRLKSLTVPDKAATECSGCGEDW